jgi:glutamine amidotransferase
MVRIALIDYDTGNLHSACRGLEHAGAEVELVDHEQDLSLFEGLVLPGDGAFDPAIQELRHRGLEQPLLEAIDQGIPFLGICIGLQLLFEGSEEGQEKGLGIIPGRVERFSPEIGLTIPHMGWNQLVLTQANATLWQGLPSSPWVYFVHSYWGNPLDPSWISATVTHGTQSVTAAISRGSIMATQFHPEKSGALGLQMLRQFVKFASQDRVSGRYSRN